MKSIKFTGKVRKKRRVCEYNNTKDLSESFYNNLKKLFLAQK
jgi:hypothetical protein